LRAPAGGVRLALRHVARFNTAMPALTRRRNPDRPDCWHIYYGDVHAGTIAMRHDTDPWEWSCGFYPGSHPREIQIGTSATFDVARAEFASAWKIFFANRSDADFQAWRDDRDRTKENFQHRKKTVDAVLRLLEQGTPLKQITRRLSLARQTVRRIARGGGLEVFRSRVSIIEPYAETLDALWTGGCRNGAELWRRLRIQGFQGSLRVVAEWATRRRLDESSNPAGRVRKTPSARKIARLMTIERDQVPRDHVSMMANIAYNVPPLFEARDLVDRFHEIMRQQKAADLDPWIAAAIGSPLRTRPGAIAPGRGLLG